MEFASNLWQDTHLRRWRQWGALEDSYINVVVRMKEGKLRKKDFKYLRAR